MTACAGANRWPANPKARAKSPTEAASDSQVSGDDLGARDDQAGQ